jgi:TRAP-type C4-dicarboxylate transport system permease small subunit
MRVVGLLDRFLTLCDRLFLCLANLCLAVMLSGNAVNIAYRAIRDTSFAIVWPWTMVLFVWSIFFGFFLLYRRRRDVVVDYCVKALPAHQRRYINIFVSLTIATVVAVMLAAAPYRLASQAGIIEIVGLPRFVLSVPFFASCLLILLNSVVEIAHAAAGKMDAEPAGAVRGSLT